MAEALVPMLAGDLRRDGRGWLSRLIHWAADARSHRVICLVLAIWMLNGFDLTFTLMAHQQGLLHEQNPLARRFLEQGLAPIALFKVGLVLIGSYPLLRFRRARITEMASIIILFAYGMLAMHWSECYKLYTLSSGGPVNIAEIPHATPTFFP